jgi:4-hydroxythreonine-4-phosphate dehydrogenase
VRRVRARKQKTASGRPQTRPRAARDVAVAITLGDPAGVGPEVALHALAAQRAARGGTRCCLVGDLAVAREASERLGLDLELVACAPDAIVEHLATRDRALVPVVAPTAAAPIRALRAGERRPGRPTQAGARVAYQSVLTAVDLARDRVVDAICTAPINKEWFSRAGVARTGHTEILAELTNARGVRLLMAVDELRVALATTHLALRDVPAALSVEGIVETTATLARHLQRWWGIARPRIAIAALNPHAGDGGIYGDEEARVIAPAVRRARAKRIDAIGPVPADTLFSKLGPRCDGVVAMYHDQGLIPVKQRDVHRAVNVTLGLPFVRTSPDHGTAYEIAGRGIADARSMTAALALAIELAAGERRLAAAR